MRTATATRLPSTRRAGSPASTVSNTTFVYDPVGKQLQQSACGVVTVSTFDAANQLDQLVTSIGPSGTVTYTFDGAGNQQIDHAPEGITTHVWNYENQETGEVLPSGARVTMSYTAGLPPGQKRELAMVAVNYLWNPINDNIIEEFDDAGNTIAEYTTEPDLYGNVVSQFRNGQTSYLLSDGQGNTTELTNDAGDVTYYRIRYSAFGEVTERTGATEIPFQYVGQKGYYRDSECRSGGSDRLSKPGEARQKVAIEFRNAAAANSHERS